MPAEPAGATPAPTTPAQLSAGFVALLRRVGLVVPVGAAITFHEALGTVGLDSRTAVYWAARATLLHGPEDVDLFDQAFAAWWEGVPLQIVDGGAEEDSVTLAVDDDEPDPGDGDDDTETGDVVTLRWSRTEILREKDFASYDDAELAEAHELMQRMVVLGARRASRRRVPVRRSTDRPDLGRTVRAALRTGGEPVERRFTTEGERVRRIVFLLDVSGSMESYARALLRFVQAAVVGRRRVEVFTLGTRLTRVTRELSSRDPDRALARAADAVSDWSGGTRLGDSLRRFNDEWGQRGMARGATVVVLSDGWDRGEPAVMAEQMQRLQRVAHQVVWVNPLKASPGYQPLAQGMAAALPYVDRFVEGHCLDSLEVLASMLSDTAGRGSRGSGSRTGRRAGRRVAETTNGVERA